MLKLNIIFGTEDVTHVRITKDDELCYSVEVETENDNNELLHFVLEEREAEEFVLVLQGYRKLYNTYRNENKEIQVSWDVTDSWWSDSGINK